MADIVLLPLPEADGFMETFDTHGCPVGSEDAWGEKTVKETIRANVAHATAANDAEIERLVEEAKRQESLKEKYITQSDGWEHRCKAAEIEIERLQAEVRQEQDYAASTARRVLMAQLAQRRAEARAEQLAEALREICKGAPESEPGDDARDSGNHDDMAGEAADWEHYRLANIARAALDQEVGK